MRTSFRNLTAGERAAFIGKYLFMGLCSLVALFPIIWVIMSSFKTNAEILSNGIGLPSSLSPDGYISALTISPILKYFGNSVIITVITTVLNVLFLAMAAYVSPEPDSAARICCILSCPCPWWCPPPRCCSPCTAWSTPWGCMTQRWA